MGCSPRDHNELGEAEQHTFPFPFPWLSSNYWVPGASSIKNLLALKNTKVA